MSNHNPRHGTLCPTHKLTPEQVATIRGRRDAGAEYGWQSSTAREFGVSVGCVNDVVHGRRWGKD